MLDEKKVMRLIARTPMIRTVQIADALDSDINEVEDFLLPLVNRGHIVAVPVMAPNNRKATGYHLSDAARSAILQEAPGISIDGVPTSIERAIALIGERGTVTAAELHAHLGLAGNDLVSSELAPALADGRLFKNGKFWSLLGNESAPPSALPPAPVVAATTSVRPTKIELVIRLIQGQANKSATNDQVREVLGLKHFEAPSSYLAGGIKTGKLARDGKDWIIGSGQPERQRVLQELSELATDFKHGLTPVFSALEVPTAQQPQAAAVPTEDPVPAEDDRAPIEIRSKEAIAPTAEASAVPLSSAAPAPADAAPAPTVSIPARFRVGDWSDGTVELQRDGVHLASLSAEEFEQIGRFWNLRAA